MIENLSEGGWVYATGVGLLGAAYALRKFITQWNTEDVATQRAQAEVDIITSLRDELDRLGSQNDKLADKVNELQSTILDLHDQIAALNLQNRALHNEVTSLRSENKSLHTEMARLHQEINRLSTAGGDDGK